MNERRKLRACSEKLFFIDYPLQFYVIRKPRESAHRVPEIDIVEILTAEELFDRIVVLFDLRKVYRRAEICSVHHGDIDDDGTIHIASPDAESCEKAKKCIDDIVFVPEVGQLYYGRVVRLMTFGAFVELAPGKDGLVHISKLADKRIEKVEDACKIGDMMWVKVTEIDEKGRVNLSHKDAMKEIAAKEAAGEPIK